jgi:hypothetical protein
MKARLLATFLFAALAVPALAQTPVQPGPEHKMLAKDAGTWNAVLELMGDDGQMAKSTGTSVVKVICGGLWVTDDFDAKLGNGPFQGHGTTGYDAEKKKFIGTWVDSMTSHIMVTEGTLDASGKVLTMTGMGPGTAGILVKHTMVTTFKDANTRVFEMFVPGANGKDLKILTITYTRADAKTDKK